MEKIRNFFLGIAAKLSPFALLIARFSVGWMFAQTGWGKLHNLEQVAQFFQSLGIPFANLQAPFVASVEFVCGVMILAGLFTRLASIPLMATMVVAIITAKSGDLARVVDLFTLSEYLLILVLAWFFVSGAGRLSIDQLICKKCAGTESCGLVK